MLTLALSKPAKGVEVTHKEQSAELKKQYDLRLRVLMRESSSIHINRAENKSKATWEVINNVWAKHKTNI